MRILFFVLTFVVSLAQTSTMASGEDSSPLKALLTGNDSRGWEAVGRLDMPGNAFCTGALIAPDLVLTAAHCLFDATYSRLYRNQDIQFLAGWRNGSANAYRGVQLAIPHPNFNYDGNDRVSRVAYDLALLRLDQPIKKSSVKYFDTDVRPRKGAEVGVVSYAHDRSENPALQEVCHVLARQSGTLLLSCDVDFGSSGAPIFSVGDDGVPKIVSVISAKADVNGRMVSLGTSLEKPLSELMALFAAIDANEMPENVPPKVLSMRSAKNGDGAKFMRP